MCSGAPAVGTVSALSVHYDYLRSFVKNLSWLRLSCAFSVTPWFLHLCPILLIMDCLIQLKVSWRCLRTWFDCRLINLPILLFNCSFQIIIFGFMHVAQPDGSYHLRGEEIHLAQKSNWCVDCQPLCFVLFVKVVLIHLQFSFSQHRHRYLLHWDLGSKVLLLWDKCQGQTLAQWCRFPNIKARWTVCWREIRRTWTGRPSTSCQVLATCLPPSSGTPKAWRLEMRSLIRSFQIALASQWRKRC